MKSKEIRQHFLAFFNQKQHDIVDSAPIVVKNDPTLMFTNAGMNQFKDYFLGNKTAENPRVVDTQKCLRVSGKHNDLEEVGVDTYHHTMFEMLGNWSFGDYFKEDAIAWAWELLTEVYQIPKDRLYITIFEGHAPENLEKDSEAGNFWKKWIAEDRIIEASKKDNFWEMGDTGPCGPCSEIHVDVRSDEERAKVDGKSLVNQDHPEVIEIWNLVFIQFNRKSDGSLEPLPDKHVDTGMGFERLSMVLQGKKSSYDTDVFAPIIDKITQITGVPYTRTDEKKDIAIRVIADHVRAITFTIVDGQLPSNNGAGYVIRRILRRAVRYAYSFLNYQQPIVHQLIPILVKQFDGIFPGIKESSELVQRVVIEEEKSFLRTLDAGLKRFKNIENKVKADGKSIIDGATAFELYDTYGFPLDLTQLIASEAALEIDHEGFKAAMKEQQDRARAAGKIDSGDWHSVHQTESHSQFVGYDHLEADARVVKYREVKQKKKTYYQIVLDITPFYAESGGQVGDIGYLAFGEEKISVKDTKKENELFLHFVNKLPKDIEAPVKAVVNAKKRKLTANNHTATHLLHAALRNVLGDHVHQKGSYVDDNYLRFDFSHFAKVSPEELAKIEAEMNAKVRANIPLEVLSGIPIDEAKAMGAQALFGEKYGDTVRVVIFDRNYSIELCGGTHVNATGELGLCKIVTETSIAAGVRRIEVLSGEKAYEHVEKTYQMVDAMKTLFKNPTKLLEQVQQLAEENPKLRKEIERMQMEKAGVIKNKLKGEAIDINGIQFIGKRLQVANADMVKKIAYDLRKEVPNLFLILGAEINSKAHLTLMFDDELTQAKALNAGKMIRTLARNIKGGGGGQAFYASAGGKNPQGIDQAINEAKQLAEGL